MSWLDDPFWRSVALLLGVTIGAGVLGIPYVFSQAGFLTGLLTLLVVFLLLLLCQLYLGEIVLSTKEEHQLPGLAGKYLGPWGKRLLVVVMLLDIYGALLAYSLGSGEILYSLFGLHPYIWSFVFYAAGSSVVFFGMRFLLRSEFLLTALLVFFTFCLFGWAFPQIHFGHYSSFHPSLFFLPYGVLLFAFAGYYSIPDMRQALADKPYLMKKAILVAMSIACVVYLLFAFLVVGVMGTSTSPVATVALGEALGPAAMWLGNLFALFAMGTSFIALMFAVENVYREDYRFGRWEAFLAATIVPLLLLLWGFGTFISVLSLVGALAGGVLLLCIIYMHHHVRSFRDCVPAYSLKNYTSLNFLLVLFIIFGIALTFAHYF